MNTFKIFLYQFALLILSTLFLFSINIYIPNLRDCFWGTVLNDLLVGIIVSYIFYYVIVYVPNKKREGIIKNNYKNQVNAFKASIITILLQNLSGGYIGPKGWDYKNLFANKNFRDFFLVKISDTQDRWHDVTNNLQYSKFSVDDILLEFASLEEESKFVLNNLEVKDERVFAFLKRISKITYNLRNYNPETDDIKSIMMFLWQIFAGWSWMDGYSDEDIFKIIFDEF